MDREEFIVKAKQIEGAACVLFEQIEALTKQAEEHRRSWAFDTAEYVKVLSGLEECANGIRECGGRIPLMLKNDDDISN